MKKVWRYALVVIAVLVLAALACGSGADTSKDEGSEAGANVICKKFVKDKLVSPASAKFPWIDEMEIKQIDADADQWRVIGFVDAENRLGAMIRIDYTCVVTYKGDDEWALNDLKMSER